MDERIPAEWIPNAAAWTAVVREGRIGTRVRVTDQAVIDAVLARGPRSVLDLGCGEGWLARALAARGVAVIGVDGVPALVEAAQQAGGGDFRVLSYEAIGDGALDVQVDVVVANFALLGERVVERLVAQVPRLLAAGGAFVVQTVHPWVASGDGPYEDGWREGSWAGFGPEFGAAPPWYFRTTGSWAALLVGAGLRVVEIEEPVDPDTGRPASLLLTAVE